MQMRTTLIHLSETSIHNVLDCQMSDGGAHVRRNGMTDEGRASVFYSGLNSFLFESEFFSILSPIALLESLFIVVVFLNLHASAQSQADQRRSG